MYNMNIFLWTSQKLHSCKNKCRYTLWYTQCISNNCCCKNTCWIKNIVVCCFSQVIILFVHWSFTYTTALVEVVTLALFQIIACLVFSLKLLYCIIKILAFIIFSINHLSFINGNYCCKSGFRDFRKRDCCIYFVGFKMVIPNTIL